MKKQLIILALLFGLLTTLEAQTMIIPKREVRAVWLTTLKNLDWPRTPGRDSYSIARQKQELRNILDKYQKANINTVLLQTVDRALCHLPLRHLSLGRLCVGTLRRKSRLRPTDLCYCRMP